MVSRDQDFLGGTIETFKYDQYNRLTKNTLVNSSSVNTSVDVKYSDATDNIKNKSDQSISDYQYSSSHKHAVTSVGNRSSEDDASGNMTRELYSRVERKKLTYTGSDRVKKIQTFAVGDSVNHIQRTNKKAAQSPSGDKAA